MHGLNNHIGPVLAVSSYSSHWIELTEIVDLIGGEDAHYCSVVPAEELGMDCATYTQIGNVSLEALWKLPAVAAQLIAVFRRQRPRLVLSTGGASGVLALLIGKLTGARTIWIESLANIEAASLSGRVARLFADVWLTQWPHHQKPTGPHYQGALI